MKPLTAAIMLIAALGLVFHGASVLRMHPPGSHGAAGIELAAAHDHDGHADHHDVAQHKPGEKHEHGKSPLSQECCASVSVVTLPLVSEIKWSQRFYTSIHPALNVVGKGLSPSEPVKPPRPAYQC